MKIVYLIACFISLSLPLIPVKAQSVLTKKQQDWVDAYTPYYLVSRNDKGQLLKVAKHVLEKRDKFEKKYNDNLGTITKIQIIKAAVSIYSENEDKIKNTPAKGYDLLALSFFEHYMSFLEPLPAIIISESKKDNPNLPKIVQELSKTIKNTENKNGFTFLSTIKRVNGKIATLTLFVQRYFNGRTIDFTFYFKPDSKEPDNIRCVEDLKQRLSDAQPSSEEDLDKVIGKPFGLYGYHIDKD